MEQRELRKEIFNILFEYELMKNDLDYRVSEFIENNKLSATKIKFFEEYIRLYKSNEEIIVNEIKNNLKGWTFERLGIVEKVLLKMSFFEILIKDEGHEIVINEAVELSKIYGEDKTKKFINGILADFIKVRDNK